MNHRKIYNYLRNTLLFVLAISILVSATGFSYKVHYCHGSFSGLALYPEFGFEPSVACGCAVTADNVVDTGSDSPVIESNSCCSNISYFSKLALESPVTVFEIQSVSLPARELSQFEFTNTELQNENVSIHDFSFIPVAPLAGRKLVLFLSQQRIPFSIYNC